MTNNFLGPELDPVHIAPRLIMFIQYFTAMILFASYSASLTSLLAVKKQEMPFDDFSSLYHLTDYKVITQAGTVFPTVLQVWLGKQ